MGNTRTISETFPKADGWISEEVDEQRRQRLVAGAVRCDKTEDEENFYLNSVWQVAGTETRAAGAATDTESAPPAGSEGDDAQPDGDDIVRDGDGHDT